MDIIRNITSAEMVGEFLQAELHSSRFRRGSLKALHKLGYNERIINEPDYINGSENTKRGKVLGLCRGWPDKYLFTNFPDDTKWFYVNLTLTELEESYRLKSNERMTDSERLMKNTAKHVINGDTVQNINNDLIMEIRNKMEQNDDIPPIILVGEDLKGKKVLIEGHSRSTAYCSSYSRATKIPAIIGISSDMNQWSYF